MNDAEVEKLEEEEEHTSEQHELIGKKSIEKISQKRAKSCDVSASPTSCK